MKIRFAESAVCDLENIREWYAGQGVPEVGLRFVSEIFHQVEQLAHHPEKGRVVPEFGQRFLRELIHTPFRIVYKLDAKTIRVVRIWRSERLLHLPADEE